jgi:hypothetical protein
MSCLAAASTQPAVSPGELVASPLLMWVSAVGLVVLMVLTVRRLARPRKLLLRDAPGRPNTLTPIHWIALMFIWLLVGASITQAVLAAGFTTANSQGQTKLSTHGQILTMIIAQPINILAALLVAQRWFRFGMGRGLGLSMRHWLFDSLRGLVAVLAVIPVCLGVLWVSEWLFLHFGIQSKEHLMLTLLPDMETPWKILIILSAVPLTALAEEIMYRGLLQSMLRRYVGPWPTILIASSVFGLMHANQPQAIPALIVLGIVLGYNYERTGRLWAPIVIHGLFNLVMIVESLLVR